MIEKTDSNVFLSMLAQEGIKLEMRYFMFSIFKRILIVLFLIMSLTSCMSTLVFNETIKIDAPISIVFSVITDYDSYDELLPMLHDSIEITSEDESGQGVTWESTGTFKGHSFTTEWTVTEFIENEMVKMEDLEEGIGETVLTTTLKDENETEYSMYISTKMFKPYEKDFIEIYREEMSIIKAESERIFSTQIN